MEPQCTWFGRPWRRVESRSNRSWISKYISSSSDKVYLGTGWGLTLYVSSLILPTHHINDVRPFDVVRRTMLLCIRGHCVFSLYVSVERAFTASTSRIRLNTFRSVLHGQEDGRSVSEVAGYFFFLLFCMQRLCARSMNMPDLIKILNFPATVCGCVYITTVRTSNTVVYVPCKIFV